MILLDTDIVVLLMQGQARVVARAAKADHKAITLVTWIEILRGRFDAVLKAADGEHLLRAQHWLIENQRYLHQLPVVEFDDDAASQFDRLRRNTKLRKIGRADLLIASIALARQTTLVTRNLRDFREVPGLKLENWAD